MDTKSVLAAALTAAARVALVGAGGWLANHGIMQSSGIESFASIGGGVVLALGSACWDVWTQYVQPVMIARLEVWKMKALDRAAALRSAGIAVPAAPTAERVDAATPSSVTPAIAAQAVAEVTKAAVPVLLVAIGLALLVAPASAQSVGNTLRGIAQRNDANVTGDAVKSGGTANPLLKPFQDIAAFIGEDIDGAITLSTQIPAIQDGHGQQCLMALKSYGDIVKAHPIPLTLHLAMDLEAFRLAQIATNQLCTNVHCTQVFADASATAQAASPVPLLIPSLHDLCAKVPQIAVVPPITSAAPASTSAK